MFNMVCSVLVWVLLPEPFQNINSLIVRETIGLFGWCQVQVVSKVIKSFVYFPCRLPCGLP